MKTTPRIKSLLIAGAMLSLTSACQKESLVDTGSMNPAEINVKQVVEAQGIAKDITFTLDQVIAGLASGESVQSAAARVGGCGTLIYDTLSSPKRLIVDYGKTNCRSGSHFLRGKLILTYTGSFTEEGAVFTYTTEDYFVDNNRYQGSRVMTNIGRRDTEAGSKIHYTVVDDFSVTYPLSNTTVRTQGDAIYQFMSGEETEMDFDDIFFIDGIQTLTDNKGMHVIAETREKLRMDRNFPYLTDGSMKYQNQKNSANNFMLDYGYPAGERDNLALITLADGTTQVITLF